MVMVLRSLINPFCLVDWEMNKCVMKEKVGCLFISLYIELISPARFVTVVDFNLNHEYNITSQRTNAVSNLQSCPNKFVVRAFDTIARQLLFMTKLSVLE